MKLYIVSALALTAVALAGCQQANLVTIQADIAKAESALASGSVEFCALAPQLQADFDVVSAVTGISAKTAADAAAAKAAAAVACANPTATNLAAVVAKVKAAKVAVSAALAASPAQ